MNKEEEIRRKERKQSIIVMGIIVLIAIGVIGQMVLSVKEETIIGEVVNTELLDEYMIVTFDNGETYNINYYGSGYNSIDLTVNSKMRIKLHYMNPFLYPNVNDVWRIVNIVKVPDGVTDE